jgi:hypothetical protein
MSISIHLIIILANLFKYENNVITIIQLKCILYRLRRESKLNISFHINYLFCQSIKFRFILRCIILSKYILENVKSSINHCKEK